MFEALKWATIQLMGVPLTPVVRPRRVALWLSVGYCLLGCVVMLLCGLGQLLFCFSPILGALVSVLLYCSLTWKFMPVTHGGEYLLSTWLGGTTGSRGYDEYRRLAVYLGLLAGRLLALFLLSLHLGCFWILPLILLSGCFVIEALRQSAGTARQDGFRWGTWLHWAVGLLVVLYGGLLGLIQGNGGLLVLTLLAYVLSLCISLQMNHLRFENLSLEARRRLYWTFAELGLLAVGLLSLMF